MGKQEISGFSDKEAGEFFLIERKRGSIRSIAQFVAFEALDYILNLFSGVLYLKAGFFDFGLYHNIDDRVVEKEVDNPGYVIKMNRVAVFYLHIAQRLLEAPQLALGETQLPFCIFNFGMFQDSADKSTPE